MDICPYNTMNRYDHDASLVPYQGQRARKRDFYLVHNAATSNFTQLRPVEAASRRQVMQRCLRVLLPERCQFSPCLVIWSSERMYNPTPSIYEVKTQLLYKNRQPSNRIP